MSSNKPNQQLQLVPESVLKKQHDLEELKQVRAAQKPIITRKKFKTSKKLRVIKPETILATAKSVKGMETRFLRVKKKGMQKRASKDRVVKTKLIMDETADDDEDNEKEVKYIANSVGAPFVFVIRIRPSHGLPREVKKCLYHLRLVNINEGIFLKLDTKSRKMLHLISPTIVYGMPSKATIKDLITRRGHGKVNKQRIPLSDNITIEKELGDKTGMICVDDLVHEITTCGEHFQTAANFLWPFVLAAPRTKFQKRVLDEKDGKVYGDRGEEIDDIIRDMM